MKSVFTWAAGPGPSPGGSRALALAVWLGLALVFTARADTWTNVAGHVVTAKLVAIEGEHVLLQNTNGRIWRVPLSSLKPADRQRAREQTGISRIDANPFAPGIAFTDAPHHRPLNSQCRPPNVAGS